MSASRPRVLIENRDANAAAAQAAALARAGFETTLCAGPSAHDGDDCPLRRGEPCHLVDDADIVVHDLDLRDEQAREVLRGLQQSYPELPIVVEATTHTARIATGDLERCTVVVPYSMEHLVGAVADALASA